MIAALSHPRSGTLHAPSRELSPFEQQTQNRSMLFWSGRRDDATGQIVVLDKLLCLGPAVEAILHDADAQLRRGRACAATFRVPSRQLEPPYHSIRRHFDEQLGHGRERHLHPASRRDIRG